MKYSDITNINSLFHTGWHPNDGDYVKENSIKEGSQMEKDMLRHKVKIWTLSILIFAAFSGSIFLLSI